MGMFIAFHPTPGTGQAIAATTATQIAGVDATKPQRVRIAWTSAGYVAFGKDNTIDSSVPANRIQLPTAAGSEVFDLGSNQNWIHSTVALTLVVGS